MPPVAKPVTLDSIKERCRIDDETGCWLWSQSCAPDGRARIWDGNDVRQGPNLVWSLREGKARPPKGWVAFTTCGVAACCNPCHVKALERARWGEWIRGKGWLRGDPERIARNREILRRRSDLTPEQVAEIKASNEMGITLAARYGTSPQVISRARRGQLRSFEPLPTASVWGWGR